MSSGMLIDTTKCIGCRSCQVTCKQWNQLPAESTLLNDGFGLQNPKVSSSSTFTLITFHEFKDDSAPGGVKYIFAKRGCMHCEDPACAAACPVTAMHKTAEGPVVYDAGKCIGCRYCVLACPFGTPAAEWDSLAPRIRKCDLCFDRLSEPVAAAVNGNPLSVADQARHKKAQSVPACVKQCPAGALSYGSREELLAEAKKRIADHPDRYVNHIYGEYEAGGTDVIYLAAVPFDQLGLPQVLNTSYATTAATALQAVPPAVMGVGTVLGATYNWLSRRVKSVREEEAQHSHATFAPTEVKKPSKAINFALLGLIAFGILSFIVRFALGLGGSTNLSNTYPWGLWIVFDLMWIALAAGAFATAGLIYVTRREDLYSVGRSAVLLGFLSYTFVAVILVADLGAPWNAWQLALNSPRHSAMFEVAWCVGLYLSILAFELLPVPLEFLGIRKGLELWRKYNPAYVVFAVTIFIYLMSRNVLWAGAAGALFAGLAYAFRPRNGEKSTPIMLAIAAVTLSTMHQSSLGSLFLLMPDKLSPVWWTPIMPVEFMLSAVSGGIAMVILAEMWIARIYQRGLRTSQLASLGAVCFWALLIYDAVRFGDLAVRREFTDAFFGPKRGLFVTEALLATLPLLLLGLRKLRLQPMLLRVAAYAVAAEIIVNRANAVLLGMTLKGNFPYIAPASYFPSIWEWGISLAPVAATILLFGYAARKFPILPTEEGQTISR